MDADSHVSGMYAALSDDAKGAAVRRLTCEINAILGTSLTERPIEADFDSLVRSLASRLDASMGDGAFAFDETATRRMIRVMGGNRDDHLPAFIRDLAEILLLNRSDRSEYQNRGATAPYLIGKLMIEYATKSRMLDRVLGALTKDYCAVRCGRLPVGCCSIPGYDMGLVPSVMMELQRLEAERAGWREPETEVGCKFHSNTGCAIALFKSPACIGMLCDELKDALGLRFPADKLAAFIEPLERFRNCYIDRERVFEQMDLAIVAGEKLRKIIDPPSNMQSGSL